MEKAKKIKLKFLGSFYEEESNNQDKKRKLQHHYTDENYLNELIIKNHERRL